MHCFLEMNSLWRKLLNSPFIYTLNNLCIFYSFNFKCQHFPLGYFLCRRSTTRIILILQFLYIQVSNYLKIITNWWSKSSIKLLCYKVDDDIFWQAVHGQVCLQPRWYNKEHKSKNSVCGKVRTLTIGEAFTSLEMRIRLPNWQGLTIQLLERTRRYVFSVISVILAYSS